ncbi:GNAT family N-acetyltransferase [Kiloniella sp. b19]|uniref:GNAT family N-acetyltransferase n=1 Tax=Kiloniella sp. GXU_MW_B19 TaxID=3141326 RepID=UPI0031E310FD
MSSDSVSIRPMVSADYHAIRAINAWHVENSTASFEEQPPSLEIISAKLDGLEAQDYPRFVAERSDQNGGKTVIGYAYVAPYHTRPAYRHTVENSIYLAPRETGKGIGRALLQSLIVACSEPSNRGYDFARMLALIGGVDNVASIRLHKALGFKKVGLLEKVGYKHDKWLDVIVMQRTLKATD